jgi:small-conductance mechanosensitive channel
LSLWQAPASAQSTVETNTPIATEAEAPSDRDIDVRIERIIDQIQGLKSVSVTVSSGVVTLRGKVAEAAMAEEAERIATRVDGVVAVRNEITEEASVSERIVPAWERIRNRLTQLVGRLPIIGISALVFCLVTLLGWWIAARNWPWTRIAPNSFITNLIRQIVRLIFMTGGLMIALDIAGATALLGTILGAAGIVGLAFGFAVRDTVENYIASILLSIRQPFRPNDFVQIEGQQGAVVMLTARATILIDPSGNHIRIPNSTVFKAIVHNFTRNPERRFDFLVGVDPDSNLRAAMDLGIRTMTDLPYVQAEPEAQGWIEELGDYTVRLRFAAWVNQTTTDFTQARSEAIRLVKLALEQDGFILPEPTYRLRMAGAGGPEFTAPSNQKTTRRKGAASKPETKLVGDTSNDHVAEKKASEERAKADRSDLLDEDAPHELG